jgi:hypothetical protein
LPIAREVRCAEEEAQGDEEGHCRRRPGCQAPSRAASAVARRAGRRRRARSRRQRARSPRSSSLAIDTASSCVPTRAAGWRSSTRRQTPAGVGAACGLRNRLKARAFRSRSRQRSTGVSNETREFRTIGVMPARTRCAAATWYTRRRVRGGVRSRRSTNPTSFRALFRS